MPGELLTPSTVVNQPVRARIVALLFVATSVFLVGITLSPLRSGFADAPNRGPGDVALYQAEVERIRSGESYYEAAANELPDRGYPTRSVFNWRTPLPVWLVAQLPEDRIANAILGALALTLLLASFAWLTDEVGVGRATVGVLLLIGALLPCVLGELVLMSELWSGVLIALSAVCFGLKRPALGVLSGIAALFLRELAAPYCIVCVVLAWWHSQRRELALWALGLAAYLPFFAWHVAQVLPAAAGLESAKPTGWLSLGGAGFVVSTAQMNAFLLLLPQWVTGLYLACALWGCATWNSPGGQRVAITIAVYCIAFSFVGNDFNQYWGSMIAPLLCLAACRAGVNLSRAWSNASATRPVASRSC